MGCGCEDRKRLAALRTDPYIGRNVLLKTGEEGTISTRLTGEKTRYLFETTEGREIIIKMNNIERLL